MQKNEAEAAERQRQRAPDIQVSVSQTFGIDTDMEVPAFSEPTDHVPDIDDRVPL